MASAASPKNKARRLSPARNVILGTTSVLAEDFLEHALIVHEVSAALVAVVLTEGVGLLLDALLAGAAGGTGLHRRAVRPRCREESGGARLQRFDQGRIDLNNGTDGGDLLVQAQLAQVRDVTVDALAILEIGFRTDLPDIALADAQALRLIVPAGAGQVGLLRLEGRGSALILVLRVKDHAALGRLRDLQHRVIPPCRGCRRPDESGNGRHGGYSYRFQHR